MRILFCNGLPLSVGQEGWAWLQKSGQSWVSANESEVLFPVTIAEIHNNYVCVSFSPPFAPCDQFAWIERKDFIVAIEEPSPLERYFSQR